jgi:hypothetical protein
MKTAMLVAALAVLAAVPATGAASTTTLHLTEKQTFQRYVDNGVKGESAGDIRIFGGPVYSAGKRVGHDRISCVVGKTCTETLWLQGGTLVADHVIVRPPRFTAAITHGTGAYAGARGTAEIVLGKVSRYTIRLTR